MPKWFRRRGTRIELPPYAAVRSTPTRGLPADLAEKEESELLEAQRRVHRSLSGPPRRPQPDNPLFYWLEAEGAGALVSKHPGGDSLVAFSSRLRAIDYARARRTSAPRVAEWKNTSASLFVDLLEELRMEGVGSFVLDACPRCDVLAPIDTASLTADDAVDCWAIMKAGEEARLGIYLSYALAAARADNIEVARDVAFETVSHVSLEDPRTHLLLGQIAVALRDRRLLREASTFLQFLNAGSFRRKLEEATRSRLPHFETVE